MSLLEIARRWAVPAAEDRSVVVVCARCGSDRWCPSAPVEACAGCGAPWDCAAAGPQPLGADLEQLERDGTAAQLRAIGATLTAQEHQRLAAEAASGDRLAELVQGVLAPVPHPEAP
jgi:hypothetical protein